MKRLLCIVTPGELKASVGLAVLSPEFTVSPVGSLTEALPLTQRDRRIELFNTGSTLWKKE